VERRFVIFLVLTLLLWSGFIALQMYLAPKRPPAPQPDPNAVAKVAEKADGKDGKKEQLDQAKLDEKEPVKADGEQPPKQPEVAPPAAEPTVPRLRGTLGSGDPASPYKMLVTWDNHGAAVERVELNSPRYKSVEDNSGYLGHLALADAKSGGATVRVVGPGTPAANAQASGSIKGGLAAGDVIQQIDGQPAADAATVEHYLEKKTRPGQSVTLTVQRASVSQPIQFTAQLARRPLEVVRPELHEYPTPGGGLVVLPEDPLSLLVALDSVGSRMLKAGESELGGLPSLHNSNWDVEQQGEDFVEFSFTLNEAALVKIDKKGGLKIVKRYTLAKAEKAADPAYHLILQVAIHNLGDEPLPVGYRLDGPTGLPLEGWWYSNKLHPWFNHSAGARDVAWQQQGDFRHRLFGCSEIVSSTKTAIKDKKPPLLDMLSGDKAAPLDYAGVDTQFFASAILPQPIAAEQPIKFRSAAALAVQDVIPIPPRRLRTADVSFRLTTSPTTIQPGAALKHDYHVFFGPKDPTVLGEYKLDALIEYGWPIFKWPAVALRGVLNGLHSLTGLVGIPNYGIAIILLTVIVRSCMIPVSLKQARSAAKMQELAPEIQKIKDKYPDDPMKQHNAVQELYKKHDFNMFGGCLPVFIQLPIFIGLYRCLSVDIDLRDAALFPGLSWASNLAGPDKLFYWKDWMPAIIADEADGWLGPFFNVFPLITVTLFLIQQKMFTPPATDEQTKMQQQMMTYMTVFMGVMFYKVPAGLCIYFITSSLWGICERKLLPKPKPKEGGSDGGTSVALAAKPASPNGSGKPPSSKRPKQRK
jgi:YidC/Oxa1 family membrane protein insertase